MTNLVVLREKLKYVPTIFFLGWDKQGLRNGSSNANINGFLKTSFDMNPLLDKNKSNLTYACFKSLSLYYFIHHDLFKNAYDSSFKIILNFKVHLSSINHCC